MASTGPDSEPDAEPVVETEAERVMWWRAGVLLDAGCTVGGALLLAGSDTDLHRAVNLLERGCTEAQLLEILL